MLRLFKVIQSRSQINEDDIAVISRKRIDDDTKKKPQRSAMSARDHAFFDSQFERYSM